jgi:hypothetical protein
VHGVVTDTSGIDAVALEIRTQPGGAVSSINCPDGNNDGLWQCLWQPGALAGLTNIELRAQATDLFGNVGPWTEWKNLLVDTTAPVIGLNNDVELALADGFLAPNELVISGTLQDDLAAYQVGLCLESEVEGEDCLTVSVQPGTSPTGSWLYDLTPSQNGDGITQTMTLYGRDGVGNLSEAISRTYRLDTVAPIITVTSAISEVVLGDYPLLGPPVLTGDSEDGGGIGEVYVRMEDEGGNFDWQTAVISGTQWSFTPQLTAAGLYTLTVEGYDLAGNAGVNGPYSLNVIAAISGLTAFNDGPTELGMTTMLTAVISSGTNVSYTWDFGDGQSASGPLVSHTYAAAGTYTATVTAVNPISSEQAETVVIVEASDYILYLPVVASTETGPTNVSSIGAWQMGLTSINPALVVIRKLLEGLVLRIL